MGDYDRDGLDTCAICGNPLPIDTAMNGDSVCDDCLNEYAERLLEEGYIDELEEGEDE